MVTQLLTPLTATQLPKHLQVGPAGSGSAGLRVCVRLGAKSRTQVVPAITKPVPLLCLGFASSITNE